MGHMFSTVRWESPTGGKFRIYSRFYDVYGLGEWKPVELQERVVGHPAFERVGECLVMIELKANGTHEIEFRKERPWSNKQIRFLDCSLDGLAAPYHWWGVVIIRPHLRIAKEAADKIASAKVKTVIPEEPIKFPIRVPPPPQPAPRVIPVEVEEVVNKKVTIAEEKKEEPGKKAGSSGKEIDTPTETKKVEETVEKVTETVLAEKKDGGLETHVSPEGKKGKKKAKI